MLNVTGNKRIRTFISYSHDSVRHRNKVLQLAQRLRADGIDCQLDAFVQGTPEEGWILWMERQLGQADFVLIVCSDVYERRFSGEEIRGKGLGVTWESILTRESLYAAQGRNLKFVPVLFETASIECIPSILRHSSTNYRLMDEYEMLLRYLTGQPSIIPGPIGPTPELVPVALSLIEQEPLSDDFAKSVREHMATLNRKVEKLTNDQ